MKLQHLVFLAFLTVGCSAPDSVPEGSGGIPGETGGAGISMGGEFSVGTGSVAGTGGSVPGTGGSALGTGGAVSTGGSTVSTGGVGACIVDALVSDQENVVNDISTDDIAYAGCRTRNSKIVVDSIEGNVWSVSVYIDVDDSCVPAGAQDSVEWCPVYRTGTVTVDGGVVTARNSPYAYNRVGCSSLQIGSAAMPNWEAYFATIRTNCE